MLLQNATQRLAVGTALNGGTHAPLLTLACAGMTTKDGQLVGPNGKALFFHGINWFGFDDGNTMVDGLWEGAALFHCDVILVSCWSR